MFELPDQLKRPVPEAGGEPDPHPRLAYPAIDQAFAEGWADPKLDDYDRYEELKR